MKLKEIEIKKVSALESFARYKYAIKRIADQDVIFVLKNEEDLWAISEVDNTKLFPIWPALEYAVNCLDSGWSKFSPLKISINEFQDEIIPQLENEGILLNIFPVGLNTGFVVDVEEFIRDLKIELKKYE